MMSNISILEMPYRPPQPRPGLKLTVKFVVRERDGRPVIIIRPVAAYPNEINLVGSPRWFMPWEERLRATVPFATERTELRQAIHKLHLWCAPYGLVQATDDQIILTGIHDVLKEWTSRAQEAFESGNKVQRRLWSSGPVMERKVEQFIGLFRVVEMDTCEWSEAKEHRYGWGRAFQELVRGRRELRVGDTRVRELPGEELVEDKVRLVFWSRGL